MIFSLYMQFHLKYTQTSTCSLVQSATYTLVPCFFFCKTIVYVEILNVYFKSEQC